MTNVRRHVPEVTKLTHDFWHMTGEKAGPFLLRSAGIVAWLSTCIPAMPLLQQAKLLSTFADSARRSRLTALVARGNEPCPGFPVAITRSQSGTFRE